MEVDRLTFQTLKQQNSTNHKHDHVLYVIQLLNRFAFYLIKVQNKIFKEMCQPKPSGAIYSTVPQNESAFLRVGSS